MGNFHSRAGSRSGAAAAVAAAAATSGTGSADFVSMRDNFDSLAALIEQFPRIRAGCRFVFVPGPGDPSPSTALPQPPLPAYFTGELRRVLPTAVFASNPCRVLYLSQQVGDAIRSHEIYEAQRFHTNWFQLLLHCRLYSSAMTS